MLDNPADEPNSTIAAGDQVIFFDYYPPLGPRDEIFQPGTILVVHSRRPDGGLACFPVSEHGDLLSFQGDTVFDHEVISLFYAPNIKGVILDLRASTCTTKQTL